jgi:hypothetical protein
MPTLTGEPHRIAGQGIRRRRGQRGLDAETAAAGRPGAQRPADRRGALAHAEQAVPGLVRPRRARPVVADPEPQHVAGVAQLDVHGRAGSVPPGVGQGLLGDAVGGQFDARIQAGDRAGDDEPDQAARGGPRLVHQVAELDKSGLRMPGGRHGGLEGRLEGGCLGVLAQHAEQAAHLGQPGPGGVADRGQALGARRGQPGGGQPGGLGLHRDHRDVVGHHVVQLAGDPGPLPPGQVIGQHLLGGLAGGPVGPALLVRAPRHRGHRRDRDRRGQQHRQDPGLGARRGQGGRGAGHRRPPGTGRGGRHRDGDPEERHPQRDGGHPRSGARQPVRDQQQRGRPRHRHQLEQDERQHRRQGHHRRRRDRPEHRGRHRGQQAERAHQQRGRHRHPVMRGRGGQPGPHGRPRGKPGGQLGHREQAEDRAQRQLGPEPLRRLHAPIVAASQPGRIAPGGGPSVPRTGDAAGPGVPPGGDGQDGSAA